MASHALFSCDSNLRSRFKEFDAPDVESSETEAVVVEKPKKRPGSAPRRSARFESCPCQLVLPVCTAPPLEFHVMARGTEIFFLDESERSDVMSASIERLEAVSAVQRVSRRGEDSVAGLACSACS